MLAGKGISDHPNYGEKGSLDQDFTNLNDVFQVSTISYIFEQEDAHAC